MLWEPAIGSKEKTNYRALFAVRYGVPMPDLQGEERPAELPKLSADGTTIVARLETQKIGVWSAATGKLRALLVDDSLGDLRAWPSHDGTRVVTATGDRNMALSDGLVDVAQVWDVASGVVVGHLAGEDGQLYGAAYSPDGSMIVTESDGGTVRLWSALDLKLLRTLKVSEGRVLDAAFSSDGARLVTASRDSIARVWDVQTLNPGPSGVSPHSRTG
jgi:WD40 repeat protein